MESKTVKRLKQKNVKRGDLVLSVDNHMGISLGFFYNYCDEDAFRLKNNVALYPAYKYPTFGDLLLPNIERSEDKLELFDHISYKDTKVYVGKDSIIEQLNSRKGFGLYAKMLEGIL